MKTLLLLLAMMLSMTTVVAQQPVTFDISNETFTGLIASAPVAIDINDDNIDDLFNNGYDPVEEEIKSLFYTNDGSANFTLDSMTTPVFSMGATAVFDADADGDKDLFYTGGTLSGNVIGFLENLGNGNFSLKSCNDLDGLGLYSVTLSRADIDNDGDDDLFLSGYDDFGEELAYLLINDGTGCFSLSTQQFDGANGGGSVLADFDNDGDPDLFYFGTRNNDTYTVVRMNTNGIFGSPLSNIGIPLIFDGKAAGAFLNSDEFADIVFAANSSTGAQSKVCFGNGDGTFTCFQQTLPQVRQGSVLLEDFDNDGDKDLLINGKLFNSNETRITKLFLNDGIGNFSNSNQVFTGVYNGQPTAIHANGDAYLDIFVAGDAGIGFPFHEPTAELYINTTPLGVNDFTKESVMLYPNPTNGIVNIELPSDVFVTDFMVTDMSGKQLNVPYDGPQIDLSGLDAGIYLLNLQAEDGQSVTKKIIKN
ncbi:MAG: T9SS type A sorting domain-containing protein [Flavobacteriaceae bacterium]|nr:T9SS type A sorting domain-containing protein [Flavobacteriaceae bacterium]